MSNNINANALNTSHQQSTNVTSNQDGGIISTINSQVEQDILGFFDCLHLSLKGFENDIINEEQSGENPNYSRKIGVFRQYIDYVNSVAENLSTTYITYQANPDVESCNAFIKTIQTARTKLLSANEKINLEIQKLSEAN